LQGKFKNGCESMLHCSTSHFVCKFENLISKIDR